jgi:hypothetical protein
MGYLACFLAGYSISFMIYTRYRDAKYEQMCVSQQQRGDYWYTRYLQACDQLAKCDRYLPNEDPKGFYEE